MVITANKPVADYYAGKCVFLTGGTGFLGKVYIEKLLYSCPDIDKIYMLIREKKGSTTNQRIKEFFDDPLFERLKGKRPLDVNKVVPIEGDITADRLGISEENEKVLINKVSIVFHAAANVKFNVNLKEAWETNVDGTRMLLQLAQRMKYVEIFIHISTAYSNTNRTFVEERLYPPPANIDYVAPLVKRYRSEKDVIKILGDRPNTYTFTKAITEHEVAKNQAHMSTIIIRPSVVCPIKEDNLKGWLKNWFGATSITSFTAKGLNRVIFGSENIIVDLIPVDYVANLAIVAGAKNNRSTELQIYNSCTSECNPVQMGTLIGVFSEETVKDKTYYMPFPRCYKFTRYMWLANLITLIFQIVPAFLADFYRWIRGKSTRYMKIQSRVMQVRHSVDYFTNRTWIMKADHTRQLYSSLSLSDKDMYPFDPSVIDWNVYLRDYYQGVRTYLEIKQQHKYL